MSDSYLSARNLYSNVRDLAAINAARASSGNGQNRGRPRTVECYGRLASVLVMRRESVRMKRLVKYGNRRTQRNKKSREDNLIKPRHFTQRDRYSTLDNIVDGVSAKGKQPRVYVFPKPYAAPAKKKKSKEYLGSDFLFSDYVKKPKKEISEDTIPKPKKETRKPEEKLKPVADIASLQDLSDRIELIEKAA